MKIGDRVFVVSVLYTNADIEKGDTGTVVGISAGPCIEFDTAIGGHDGDGLGKNLHCWWIFREEIEIKKFIPNNSLSKVVYPELVPTDCGKYLVEEK